MQTYVQDIVKTDFRCTNCWSQDRRCSAHGRCIHCGQDMHRPWPWGRLGGPVAVGCPITGKFSYGKCECKRSE
jgi:hypothetical protein